MSDVQHILDDLGLKTTNSGACTGRWITPAAGREAVSINPTTGEPIASVIQADEAAYETVLKTAAENFVDWRMRPAPARGEIVRELGNELRKHKEPLGRLVTLEMGKILSEGLGEVQEMIDMCDFAVGLSRQLYGPTMMSERPRSVWSASSRRSTSRWRCGRGTRPWPPSAATPPCGNPRPRPR